MMSLNKLLCLKNFLLMMYFVCLVPRALTFPASFSSDLNRIERREMQCNKLYSTLSYFLWKRLCGTQTAGKREDPRRPSENEDTHRFVPYNGKTRIEMLRERMNEILNRWRINQRNN